MKVKQSEIELRITDSGIRRVAIYCDNPAEQARAHELLARVAGEVFALDEALRASKK